MKWEIAIWAWSRTSLLLLSGFCAYGQAGVDMSRRHQQNPHQNTSIGVYPCPKCDRIFTNYCTRLFHIESKHEGKLFPCVCGKTYTYRTSLNAHLRKSAQCVMFRNSQKSYQWTFPFEPKQDFSVNEAFSCFQIYRIKGFQLKKVDTLVDSLVKLLETTATALVDLSLALNVVECSWHMQRDCFMSSLFITV